MAKWDGGVRPVFVCRLACEKTEECPNGGDVCCPGIIHGKTYGKMAGCVPESLCPVLLEGDAGAAERPPAPRPEAGAEASAPDAGARDVAAADAAVEASAPADAAPADAPGDAS
jgi:hypothetical protein